MKFHFEGEFLGHPVIFDWEDGAVSGPGVDWLHEHAKYWAGEEIGPAPPAGIWYYKVSDSPLTDPRDMAAILMDWFDWIPPELEPYFKPVYYDSPQFDEHGNALIY
ncbi:MAG: hypothetical protein LBS49_01205 [Candidatus Accumulibacter sp.]|jgi:hypothetical protein|nr:hypothetical protein [Accumulibacter sp.]